MDWHKRVSHIVDTLTGSNGNGSANGRPRPAIRLVGGQPAVATESAAE
jgi:hypothetical protein